MGYRWRRRKQLLTGHDNSEVFAKSETRALCTRWGSFQQSQPTLSSLMPYLCKRSGQGLPCKTALTCRTGSPPPPRGCAAGVSAPV